MWISVWDNDLGDVIPRLQFILPVIRRIFFFYRGYRFRFCPFRFFIYSNFFPRFFLHRSPILILKISKFTLVSRRVYEFFPLRLFVNLVFIDCDKRGGWKTTRWKNRWFRWGLGWWKNLYEIWHSEGLDVEIVATLWWPCQRGSSRRLPLVTSEPSNITVSHGPKNSHFWKSKQHPPFLHLIHFPPLVSKRLAQGALASILPEVFIIVTNFRIHSQCNWGSISQQKTSTKQLYTGEKMIIL